MLYKRINVINSIALKEIQFSIRFTWARYTYDLGFIETHDYTKHLLFTLETWITHCHHFKSLEIYHKKCLRCMKNINWKSKTVESLEKGWMSQKCRKLIRYHMHWGGVMLNIHNALHQKQISHVIYMVNPHFQTPYMCIMKNLKQHYKII